jgi:hypothetical protein
LDVIRFAVLAAVLASAVQAQTWIFPALSWGPDQWSYLKFENNGRQAKVVEIEVYDATGRLLPVQKRRTILPQQMAEVRIDRDLQRSSTGDDWVWARVEQVSGDSGLDVKASTEFLRGNQIATYLVQPKLPSPFSVWSGLRSSFPGRGLYFLDLGQVPVHLTICAAETQVKHCGIREQVLVNRVIRPKETMAMRLPETDKPMLVIEASPRSRAIVGILGPQRGTVRNFSSESSIQFEEPDR